MSAITPRVGAPLFARRTPFPAVSSAELENPAAVAAALQDYFGGEQIAYQERPQPISWGWETHVYRLQFEPSNRLPNTLSGPLILRIYASAEGISRARHEFAVLQRLQQFDFPAPKPLHLETDCHVFGGPFLLLERIPGDTLFHSALRHPWKLMSLTAQVAALHARLHELPAEGFADAKGSFLSRRLEEMHELIGRYDLHGLRVGLDWLTGNRPAPLRPARLLHLDWHPLNLICGANGRLAVVDWCESDVGDPHADLATTCVLARCAPAPAQRWWEKALVPLTRKWAQSRYLNAYRKLSSVDEQRLDYFRAWAVLRRLAIYGRWKKAGPASTGSKQAVLRYLQRDHLEALYAGFREWTGITLAL